MRSAYGDPLASLRGDHLAQTLKLTSKNRTPGIFRPTHDANTQVASPSARGSGAESCPLASTVSASLSAH